MDSSGNTAADDLTREYMMLTSYMKQALSVISIAHDDNSAAARQLLHPVGRAIKAMQLCKNGILNRSHTWRYICSGADGHSASATLLSEHRRFTDAYAALHPIAVTRLRQLEATPTASNAQVEDFLSIWDIIVTAGMVQWPTTWPEDAIVGNLPLYAALGGFMAWFLAFSRGSSHLYTCLQRHLPHIDLQVRIS